MGTLQSWRKAYGALKDSTKVGLVRVNSEYADLDVAIVKATNHVECPPKDRHLRKIFAATSVTRARADVAYCIHALSRRLHKTRNWTVALKTLIVIHRLLREGDPTFREELLNFSQRGRILQLSNFKDDSSPIAWDCSAWVRTYALFLEERLECFRVLKYDTEAERLPKSNPGQDKGYSRTRDLDGEELLEQLPALQQLLYRLIGCRPEGAANHNHVIQYALALVLKESFKVYCAINDGIINLIDKFFEMAKHEAITSLEIYKRAGQQARSLSDFYEACKGLELARNFQFPVLREPPQSFLTTMEEYIKEAPRVVDVPAEPLLLTYRPDDGLTTEDTEPSHEEREMLPSDDVVVVSEETEPSPPPPPSANAQNFIDTDDLWGLNTGAPYPSLGFSSKPLLPSPSVTIFFTMANPQASPILHHPQNHLSLFHFRTTTSPRSFSSLHFRKPLLFLSSSSSFSSKLQQSEQQCNNHQVRHVSTVPVEYSTPTPPESDDFLSEIDRLKSLLSKLDVSKDLRRKDAVIDADSRVRRFFSENRGGLSKVFGYLGLNSNEMFLVKCVIAAGQEHALCMNYEEAFGEEEEEYTVRSSVKNALYALVEMIERFDVNSSGYKGRREMGTVLDSEEIAHFRKFLTFLEEIEQFYDCIGGIIGYQVMVLELLHQSSKRRNTNRSQLVEESLGCQYLEMHTPSVLDLTQEEDYASQAALWGIEGLPDLGEIYPLGGAADRLGLIDSETGECLPAAMLAHCGRTLLEGLIRDLQAREFLYFKLYGKQCVTPVAIMTSAAKNNHEHVSSLCERLKWFGRGQSNFRLFEQPLVPAVSAEDGQWIVSKPFVPVSKPGGHGVIWKLAYDKGVFNWFYDHGRKGATVRQVSNVVAATDVTLLALAGIGLRYNKKLGFASCKRNAGATEGINVLMEKKNFDGKWEYGISCIEYTEFDKFGISNRSPSSNGLQADFPANTNILYVDLHSAELIGSSSNAKSLPNMVLNTKKRIEYLDQYGDYHSVMGGRLECTMQNIADNFFNKFPSRCHGSLEDKLDTYIVYNERRKVTSSAKKKKPHASAALHQTPDGALLDILRNGYDLLTECDIKLPMIEANDKYVDSPPPYLILLHPALGPLWEVSRQKFKGGSISSCSELQLEIAEFSWNNVQVDGSLIVTAENAMGSTTPNDNGEPILQYGLRCGKCKLHNVNVVNRGIDWNSKSNVYWRNDVNRLETCKIILHGNAEFEASNVTIEGHHVFEVPDGHKLKITSGNAGLSINLEALKEEVMETGSWYWNYQLNGSHIHLQQVEVSQS